MSADAGRVVDAGRLLAYAIASEPPSVASVTREMTIDLAAAMDFAERGESATRRGAAHVATVSAIDLATTPSRCEDEHRAVVAALRCFVALSEPVRRPDAIALLDAGLRADVELRLSVGLAPFGARLSGWLDGIDGLEPRLRGQSLRPPDPAADRLALYHAAAGVRDVDAVLMTSHRIVGDLVALPPGGRARQGAWRILSRTAFGLCVEVPGSLAERLDRRRTLILLCLTLRRRRPRAAAVLRRRLALDRRAWPGSVIGEPPAPGGRS